MDTLPKGSRLYFMGIGGTGMAAVAGLCQAAGFEVSGSDAAMYPPMSTMLEQLKIPVKTPYDAKNFEDTKPDLVVVANALSRGHVELEPMLRSGVPYTSFPKLTGEAFLSKRTSIVVTGTHGKTTTSSLLAHILFELGEDPSFIIGGIPRNFPRSFRLGKGETFVIEGDEYDTAFFDKGPKFLHYFPKHLIINNIEFDHADIYKNVEAIEEQFLNVCKLVPEDGFIIANVDDPRTNKLISNHSFKSKIIKVSTLGKSNDAQVRLVSCSARPKTRSEQTWSLEVSSREFGNFNLETSLSGHHMMANIVQCVALLESLVIAKKLKSRPTVEAIASAVASFKSVSRRLDHLGSFKDIDVYEDFAHHPTAVGLVIEGFRSVYPKRRLLVAFEPKNATSRRNVFMEAYVEKLGLADRVYIGPSPEDKRIAETERMDVVQLAKNIGEKAKSYPSNDRLLESILEDIGRDDAVIFMSAGSFSGVQYRLIERLKAKVQI